MKRFKLGFTACAATIRTGIRVIPPPTHLPARVTTITIAVAPAIIDTTSRPTAATAPHPTLGNKFVAGTITSRKDRHSRYTGQTNNTTTTPILGRGLDTIRFIREIPTPTGALTTDKPTAVCHKPQPRRQQQWVSLNNRHKTRALPHRRATALHHTTTTLHTQRHLLNLVLWPPRMITRPSLFTTTTPRLHLVRQMGRLV